MSTDSRVPQSTDAEAAAARAQEDPPGLSLQGAEVCRAPHLHHLWPATLQASRDLGLEEILPRIIARHLLRALGIPPGSLVGREGWFIYRGPHLCGHPCPGDGSCMTALLVEAAAEELHRGPLRIESVWLQPGELCEVVLIPFAPAEGRR